MWHRQKLCRFLNNNLKLAQLNLGQGYDTPSDHKESLCKVGMSDVSAKEKVQT